LAALVCNAHHAFSFKLLMAPLSTQHEDTRIQRNV